MAIVNLSSSSFKLDNISQASSNIERYVLEGKTFIDNTFEDESSIKIGTLKDKTLNDLILTLNQNNLYTIPEGNYLDNYNINIPSILNYTSGGSARSDTIFSGYTAYVNGVKITGTGKVAALNTPSNSASYTSITLNWSYPSNKFISGVAVCCRKNSYETSNPNNSLVYMGSGTSCMISNLTTSTNYYISFFPYCIINGTYKWYSPNGNIVPSYTVKVKTRYRSSGGGGGGGGGGGCHCGCNDNCNHVSYGVVC